MKNRDKRKAFTLIELLIVIAIIAVLATVVILSLNPAELLRQSRDSNRISDMATLKTALSLYLADQSSPALGTAEECYVSIATPTDVYYINSSGASASSTNCTGWYQNATVGISGNTSRAVNDTGWLPVNFSSISSGSPIGTLPVDPVDQVGSGSCSTSNLSACSLLYTYVSTSTVYEVGAKLESQKYAYLGTNATTSSEYNSGGYNPYFYYSGTSLSL